MKDLLKIDEETGSVTVLGATFRGEDAEKKAMAFLRDSTLKSHTDKLKSEGVLVINEVVEGDIFCLDYKEFKAEYLRSCLKYLHYLLGPPDDFDSMARLNGYPIGVKYDRKVVLEMREIFKQDGYMVNNEIKLDGTIDPSLVTQDEILFVRTALAQYRLRG